MAEGHEPISKVEGIGKKAMDKVQKALPEELEPKTHANKDHFDSLMAQERNKESLQAQDSSSTKNSLIEEVTNLNNKVDGWRINIQPEDLVAQAQEAIQSMEAIKEKLASPNLEIRAPVQRLLNRKLSHIDENLKIALDKAGVEYNAIEQPEGTTSTNPIERFLGFLSHGQNQLDTLTTDIASLQTSQEELSPANMLAIQIKVNYVQQELELFTNLLNKSLESTKTMMNVQV